MRGSRAIAVAGVLLSACKETPPPLVTLDPATSASQKLAPAASAAPTSKRALADYPSPIDSRDPGCALTGDWDVGQPRALRFRASAPPFATLPDTKKAELHLLEGESPFAFVELSSQNIRAFGFVSEEIKLHPAKPFLMAGYIAPATMSPLVWRGSRSGKVAISLDVGDFLKPSVPVRDERACQDFALTNASVNPRSAIPEPTEKTAQLPVKGRIPLRKSVSEKPVVELDPTGCTALIVDVLQISGPDARVVVTPCEGDPSRSYAVVGFIPASLLKAHSTGTGGSWSSGGLRMPPDLRPPGRKVICPSEVPFTAEQSGETHLVGAIAANVVIDVYDPGANGWVEVAAGAVIPGAGVKFFAKESVIAGCKPK